MADDIESDADGAIKVKSRVRSLFVSGPADAI